MIELVYHMILNISLLVIFTQVICQLQIVQDVFVKVKQAHYKKIVMIVLFSSMAILSTYTGIKVNGAIANTRAISVMVAGILGGPWVGIPVGLIAGIHRYAIDINGLTGLACCISTIVEGFIASSIHFQARKTNINLVAFSATFIAEILQMIIILVVARPFEAAQELVSIISIPMTLFNSLGVVLMLQVVDSFFSAQQKKSFEYTHSTLHTLDRCFPYLRKGYNDQAAMREVCELLTSLPWVKSCKMECFVEDWSVNNSQFKCSEQNWNIPINVYNNLDVVLTLYIYPLKTDETTQNLLEKQIGSIIESQLKYAYLDVMNDELQKAQWDHLQAQINPHFFFNTLSTAASLCQIDGDAAHQMLVDLGDYFRKTLKTDEYFVNYQEEVDCLILYLNLTRKRFEEKLIVTLNLVKDLPLPIMSFMLLPLVQVAIEHSLIKDGKQGIVSLNVEYIDDTINILVTTNGNFDAQYESDKDELLLLGRRIFYYYRDQALYEVKDNSISIKISGGTI